MSQDGETTVRCDLHAILSSSAEGQQQQQHPLTPLLRLLNSGDFVKIVDDGRGIQDAIATDLAAFDTALLSHVIDASILPLFFGYEDRYAPRLKRGVVRLPTAREAATFLRATVRPLPATVAVNGRPAERLSFSAASEASSENTSSAPFAVNKTVFFVLEQLAVLRSIADAQLRPSLFRAAATQSTCLYLIEKEQKAVAQAQALFATLRRQQQSQRGGGGPGGKKAVEKGAKTNATAGAPLSRQEIEAAVSNCYAAACTVTMADNAALEAAALADVLAASRRYIDTLGAYHHPSLSSNAASTADARAHLASLLSRKRANYLPFGVIQPFPDASGNVNAASANNSSTNPNGGSSSNGDAFWQKQRVIAETTTHRHQQRLEQQHREAALNATRTNATLAKAIVDTFGTTNVTPSATSATAATNGANGGFKPSGNPNAASAIATVTVRSSNNKKKGSDKRQTSSAGDSSFLGSSVAAPSSAATSEQQQISANPNRPQEVVQHCYVCYLPFTAKVSSHAAKRQKTEATAANDAQPICPNCVERALPCEFFRRGCCFRSDCDYAHVLIPCPYGAQCIGFAIEGFAKQQQQQMATANAAVASSSSSANGAGNGVKFLSSSSAAAAVGCCPFVHPGEAGYPSHLPSAASSASASPIKAAPQAEEKEKEADSDAAERHFTVRSPNTANAPMGLPTPSNNGAPSGANNGAGGASTASLSMGAIVSSGNASLSALFQPSLVNPMSAIGEGVVGAPNNGASGGSTSSGRRAAARRAAAVSATDDVGEGQSKKKGGGAAKQTAANNGNNNNNSNAPQQKKQLCPLHFYAAGGCPHGSRCRYSHAPIPLYVPIPVVAKAGKQ